MEKTPDDLVRLFERMTARIECERRKMFGCPCYFINGNMFTGTFEDNLFVRLGEGDRERALADHPDIRPFEPVPGRKMREYLLIPHAALADEALYEKLLRKAVAHARSLPPKKRS